MTELNGFNLLAILQRKRDGPRLVQFNELLRHPYRVRDLLRPNQGGKCRNGTEGQEALSACGHTTRTVLTSRKPSSLCLN